MTDTLPDPLVPVHVDLRDFGFMPLHVQRLRDSELVDLSTGDEFKAAVLLWAYAWHQQPAASIPDDDRILAARSGAGTNWRRVKEMALRGFIKCSDGRLYHPLIAEAAADAWRRRGEFQQNREHREDRKERYRARLKKLSAELRAIGITVPKDRSIETLERVLEEARTQHKASTQGHQQNVSGDTSGDTCGDVSGDTAVDTPVDPGDALDSGQGQGQGQVIPNTSDLPVAPARPPAEPPQLSLVDATQRPLAKGPPDCPHADILALWAEVLPAMPQHDPGRWRGARADHLRARWRETAADKRWATADDGLRYFRKLFAYVGQSAFLTGRSPVPAGKRPFVIELEWLVNRANWDKVLEGKYHPEAAA